jgi:glycosyltransferase involved in cell wall biosynthesis
MSLLAQELASRGYKNIYFTRPPYDSNHRYSKMVTNVGIPVRVLPRFDQLAFVKLMIYFFSALLTIPYAIFRLISLSEAWKASQSIFLTTVAKLEKRQIKGKFDQAVQEARGEDRQVILHIWGPAALTPLLLEWAKENQIPSIYHEMGESDEQYIKMFSMEETVKSINLADRVICVSPSVSENMRRIFGYKGEIDSIYDMVVDPGESWIKGQKHGGRVTFGAIGRLVPHKRHSELIQALKALCDDGYDAALVIASDGPMRGSLEELAEALGLRDRVKFFGEFENLEEVMAQFDVFTLTSSSESQCMPVTESMAYGKAVVVSRFGGIPDFVQDGVTGFLVPVGDLASLISALKRLIDDPALRENMGKQGRERFLQMFTPEKVGDLVETVYKNVLEARGR